MHSYENRSQIRALRTVFTRDEVPEVPELEALVQPGELRGEAGRLVYVQAHDLHLRRDHAIVRGEAAPGVTTQLAAVGLAIEPKVLALVRARFLWRFPYLERTRGVFDGVRRGPVGPPGPELAAQSRAGTFRRLRRRGSS